MLYRIITRYSERHEYDVEVLDFQPGEEAGLKSAALLISGPSAYGNLKSEAGVHRLVRISPFDSQSRRHTAFASVSVVPELDDAIEVEIDEKDLRAKYEVVRPLLDERQRRLIAAADAVSLGRGGVSKVARASGLSRTTIHRGIAELREGVAEPEQGPEARRRSQGGLGSPTESTTSVETWVG